MKSGKVQQSFNKTATTQESHRVFQFKNVFGLIREMYRGYKSGADKLLIFFDKN